MYASGRLTVLTIKKKMIFILLSPFFFKQTLRSLMEVQGIFLLIMFWRPKRSRQVPHNVSMKQDDFAHGWHLRQEKLSMFLRKILVNEIRIVKQGLLPSVGKKE